ncbi:hypothetical protein [[Limnothrix rosea] IAM M-220]|uniref:hypothetical protein n=1 Tax=[Limnothrix rosea] IAM M-220 TaxID=454133 RepID=UPI000965680C|nr:hypothetical protein [[Limnothrix rosea] IAM M-220]OKH11316.1 hypothetical protein NIES208_17445 [[Limnothrix rosea] IAM M-220]
MSYSFDLLGVTPLINFFEYQQKNEQDPYRPKTYIGSYNCTLDSFIDAMDMIPKKPEWDWDQVVEKMVQFWVRHEDRVRACEDDLNVDSDEPQLVIARVVNIEALRDNFELLFDV